MALTTVRSFIDNNLPTQWSIKMKFAPLGHTYLNSCYLDFCIKNLGR